MNRILDDLDPYAGQAPSVHASFIQSTDSDSVDWLASLGAGYTRRNGHARGSLDAAERSALIDSTASPPAPPPAAACGSSSTTRPRRNAPLSLLDDSFAFDTSPIRIAVADDSDASTETAYLPATVASSRNEVNENVAPVLSAGARPARKRWSVMSKLKDEQLSQPRSTLSPPAKELTPLKQADQSTFFSPTQLEAVDVSLIADEGGSFLAAMADSSDTVDSSRFVPIPAPIPSTSATTSHVEDLSSETLHSREESGGMSVLLQRLDIGGADSSNPRDPGLAQSSILPASLTSSHRRALQQSVAPVSSALGLPDATFALDEPTRGNVSLLNCSTASFKDYRDSPRKPRLALTTHAEDWSLEIERDERDDSESEGDGGKTPRPIRKAPRVSDATSEGSSGASFCLDGLQTSTLGTAILNQSPPTAALKPESTGTLRLEYGLDSLPSSASTARSRSPPLSPVSDLASSTCTVVGPGLVRSSTANTVREGDLLGVEALAPRPALKTSGRSDSSSASLQSKTLTGAERLKKRLEELRAQKSAGAPSQEMASLRRSGSLRASGSAKAVLSAGTTATPARRLSLRPSLAPATVSSLAPATTGRLPRSRSSLLPASGGSAAAPAPTTPGERKGSTAMRLERLRSERKERELARTGTPGRAGGGLVRSASFVATRQSLASSTGPSAGRLPPSRSLADLALLGSETTAPVSKPTVRRGSLLPAPALSRRTSLVPPASRSRTSLAPSGTSNPSAQQSLIRSESSARPSLAPSTSIRRSSSLHQVAPVSAASGRRSFIAAPPGRPAFASIAPPQARASLQPVAAARAPRSSLAAVPQR